MTLSEEYKNQNTWRNWKTYIERLPIRENDTILDLGCSSGDVTKLLAEKALNVIGIDQNSDFINEAITKNKSKKIQYINADLRKLKDYNIPLVDGIWTSFTVAYFPDFKPVLDHWLSLLKPNGWIAIVEMNDLFAHFPLTERTKERFKEYYSLQRKNNIYDFEMGGKIKDILLNKKLNLILEESITDKELTFNSSADRQILTAWENRLDRMIYLQNFLGKEDFTNIKKEFLECLLNKKHTSKTEVKFIIAKK